MFLFFSHEKLQKKFLFLINFLITIKGDYLYIIEGDNMRPAMVLKNKKHKNTFIIFFDFKF